MKTEILLAPGIFSQRLFQPGANNTIKQDSVRKKNHCFGSTFLGMAI